jgi:hypothetical protein
VGDNVWIEEIVPDLYDLSLGAPAINAQLGQDARHEGTRRLGVEGLRPLQWRQINASPLGKRTLARARFAGAARRGKARE